MNIEPEIPIVDYIQTYKSVMQFNKNKTVPIHQWYPFVEGYSKEFISGILDELPQKPELVIDPFAGSGTTALELSLVGINSICFEVSPFMHLLTTVKLYKYYNYKKFNLYLDVLKENLNNSPINIRDFISPPNSKTIEPNGKLTKWQYNTEVLNGILDIKYSISKIKSKPYSNLFKIALSSILLEVSNVYRNGKCLSYKPNWKNTNLTREDVKLLFLSKVDNIIARDIKDINKGNKIRKQVKSDCLQGDSRTLSTKVKNESIDLLITSPPYLNSRDYTDIYCIELWVLDLIGDYEELRNLRGKTLRSHVQLPLDDIELLDIPLLKEVDLLIAEKSELFWNKSLKNMIRAYFLDLHNLFRELYPKFKSKGVGYVNVANSAYFGIEIKVDEILAEILNKIGYTVTEIRIARYLKSSSQQKESISRLRESVIVFNCS